MGNTCTNLNFYKYYGKYFHFLYFVYSGFEQAKLGLFIIKVFCNCLIPVLVGLLSFTRNASRACLLSKNYSLNKNAIRLLETFQKLFELKLRIFSIFVRYILCLVRIVSKWECIQFFEKFIFGISAIAILVVVVIMKIVVYIYC